MTHIHGIAVDPTLDSRLLLATHHGFFVVQTDDGMATRISRDQNDYMGFTPHPENPTVMFASGHPSGGGNLKIKDRQFKWGFRAVRASEVTLEEGRLGVGREMREVRPGAAGLKMSRRGPGVLLARMGCVPAAQRRRQMDG